jgi:hypothetical protein
MYSNSSLSDSHRGLSGQPSDLSEAEQLCQDWVVFKKWLKSENERVAWQEAQTLPRPLSCGVSPPNGSTAEEETAAIIYQLRRQVEDALVVAENRAKRLAREKGQHIAPGDAAEMRQMRHEVEKMPQLRPAHTFDSGFEEGPDNDAMEDSTQTIRLQPSPSSSSPVGSPDCFGSFGSVHSPHLPSPLGLSVGRASSVATTDSEASGMSSFSYPSVSPFSTANTTPEDRPLRSKLSVTSLATLTLGEGALQWTVLCKRVEV